MYTDSENPPVAKLPFVLGDLALLATAGLLAWASPRPWDGSALLGIFACVALGAVLLVVPFLLDYSRRLEQLADERQATINRLVQTAAAAAEQASIAATSLHALARDTAELMVEMKNHASSPREPDWRPELQDLREEVSSLTKQLKAAPARVAAMELPPSLHQRLDELAIGLSTLQAGWAQAPPPLAAARSLPASGGATAESLAAGPPEPKKARRTKREVTGLTPPLFAEGLLNADITLHEDDADPLAPELQKPLSHGDPGPLPIAPPLPVKDEPSAPSPPAPAAASAAKVRTTPSASDGPTRLTVTAYIGIGNKLFLRGEGAGLSVTEGVPLQFVSIGKWRWEADAANDPVKVSVWKNDEQRCDALGDFELLPGQAHEVTADF